MRRLALPATVILLLTACSFDHDDDGLKNGEEKDLGLDPKVADSDGDGLNDGDEAAAQGDPLNPDTDGDGLLDGEEVTHGSSPAVVDTDEDTYTDFDEVQTGHDPADPDDRIYKGYWPYYAGKDEISGRASMDGTLEVGKRFGRYKALDQFGDEVDLWDLYNEDKWIIIDQSAQWCPPCNEVSAWLDGTDGTFMSAVGYDPIRKAVKDGDIYWITVLIQDSAGAPAQQETAREWYRSYKTPEVPVLADSDYAVAEYMPAPGIPAFALLTPHLEVDTYNSSNGYAALDAAMAELAR